MTTETDLKSLVEFYAKFDSEKGYYTSTLSQDEKARVERSFSQMLLKWLLQDGPEKEHIQENYNKLIPFFDTKNSKEVAPEVLWIDDVLSHEMNEGSCLNRLFFCYQKLTSPENFKNIQFSEIVTREDLRKWLENFKGQSITHTERTLYNGLISLLDESTEYFDEVGKIKPKGIRVLLSSLPMILVSLGTVAFVEELFAIYALYFVLLKSGQLIGKSNAAELKTLGTALQKISSVTAMTTTTLLVHLVEMVFWGSRQCYVATLRTGSMVLEPLLSSDPTNLIVQSDTLEEDLLQASQNRNQGIGFINYQLKLIAAPIEAQKGLLGQQYFLGVRAGKTKLSALDKFLFNLQMLDQNKDPIETKFKITQELIRLIKKNKSVYIQGGKTAAAIDKAENFLTFLIDNPFAMQHKPDEVREEKVEEIGSIAERYGLFLKN